MYCLSCGKQIVEGSRFCAFCGAPQTAPTTPAAAPTFTRPAAPRPHLPPRGERHRRILGICWIIYGTFSLLARVLLFSILFNAVHLRMHDGGGMPMVHGFGAFLPLLAQLVMLRGVLALISGVALLANSRWARVLAILTAVLSLFHVPWGTALGIYTLWALVPEACQPENN